MQKLMNFLVKKIIKNYDDIQNPRVREKYGKLAGYVGIISNFILFLFKVSTGIVTNSIAIIADSVNNLSDAGSSVITLVGFKLAGKPPDEKHPYGHARMEYLTGLIISFIITILGLQLFTTSINKIFTPEKSEFGVLSIIILTLSILIKLLQSMFNKYIGKKINSATIKATASDSLNDVIATSVVLIGVLISKYAELVIDGYLGVLVAGFITYSGLKLVMETSNPLLGMAPDKELVDNISNKIRGYEGVIGLHDLVVHNYGPERCFASIHVEVPANQDIMISHDVIDNIEYDFLKELNIHLVIHLDPIVTDNERINHLNLHLVEILKGISENISMHDFRVVFGTTHTNLLFDVSVPTEFYISDKELCHVISEKVKKLNNTFNTVITIDRNYMSTTTKD